MSSDHNPDDNTATPAATAVDRSGPPNAAASERFHFPSFERVALASGLTVLLAPRAASSLTLIEYVCDAGAWLERPEDSGLATLAAGMLDEGTGTRGAEQLALDVEGLGAWLASGADWDSTSVALGGLSRHGRRLAEICADIVLDPAFAPEELERARRRRLAELERQRSSAATLSYLALARQLFGASAYGRPLLGRPETVSELSPADCRQFWERGQAAGNGCVLIAGAFESETMLPWIEERFSGLLPTSTTPEAQSQNRSRSANGAASEGSPLATSEDRTVVIVDRPGSEQSELRIGCRGIARNHPDRPALVLLSTLLGGKFTSRINLNLRERHGFTYGAHARFVEHRDGGLFVISAAVDTPSVAAASREVLGELERLSADLVPRTELADTRSYIRGVFPYTLQTLQGLLSRLEQLAVFGLPDDYFDGFLAELDAVDPQRLRELACRYLDPRNMTLAVAGPAASLRSQLDPLGRVEVET
jgi:zinc protease